MKHLLLALSLWCAITVSSLAQPTDYYDRMEHVFGTIDKTKVNTGLLKEFGVRLNEVEAYNGVTSTTNWTDVTQFQSLYHSLYSMRVGSNTTMSTPASVYSFLENQQTASPDVVLLAAEYYTYNQYKTNAYTNGDVTVVNDRIYDVAGRDPYDTKTAFAVSPMEYHLNGNGFAFKLQSNMIYTNSSQTLSSVQVDFDNGQGYQTILLNTIKNVSYSSGGEKELKAKFVYSGGSTLYSHSKLYVDYVAPPPAQARFDGANLLFDKEPISGGAYLGSSAIGEVTVELATGHSAITKPLIVVEGFDPFNDFYYKNFIVNSDPTGINVGTIDLEINLSTGKTLNQAIEDEGYDLVFINYRNSTDYIQRNAYMVEAVIEWVNGQKVGSEQNVVLGMSMGGLVARYALRHMETTGRTHETSLYISHDVPHQGANVPLAYQAFVRHLVGESIGLPVFLSVFTIDIVDLKKLAPDLENGLELLQSPAAQQMLIYQLQGSGSGISVNNAPHNNFATEYKNLGYPTQGGIKNIAISNGSECGSPLDFGPYATLANIDQTVDLPFFTTNIVFTVLNVWSINPIRSITSFLSTNTDIKAKFNMHALPEQQNQRIYRGRIYTKKKVLGFINVEEPLINERSLYSSSDMLPLDNAGGGVYDINKFVSLPAQINQFIFEQRFNFIPTYSSLDIGGGSQPIVTSDLARVYSPLAPPASPKDTPFDNFFSNPTISQNHTQFTLNNGNWLLDELQGTNAFYSCASSCAVPPEILFTGPSNLCTSNMTFSLPDVPASANISWSVSPASLFAVDSGTGNSFTTRATNSSSQGQGVIMATVNLNSSCGSILADSKEVWVGRPRLPTELLGPTQLTPGYQATYHTTKAHGLTSYSWDIPSGCYSNYCWTLMNYYTSSQYASATIMAGDPGLEAIEVIAHNSCGSDSRYLYVNVQNPYGGGGGGGGDCGPYLTISPNPSISSTLTVNVIYPPDPCDPCDICLTKGDLEFDYIITDKNFNKLRQAKTVNQVINTIGLKPDVYLIKIKFNGSFSVHRVAIF